MAYTSFDDQHLIEQFRGDEEILLDMINIFQDGLYDLLEPIRQSVLSEDADKLRINAHTFKGVLGNFYSEEGSNLAFELEKRGAHSEFIDAMDLLNQLENLLQKFVFELNSLKVNLVNQS